MASDSSSISLWLILIVATMLYAFASLVEGAIGSLSRARVQRLADQDERAASQIEVFAERPVHYLTDAAVMKLAALTGATVVGIHLLNGVSLDATTLVDWLITLVAALVLGWIVPRSVGTNHPEQVILALAFPLRVLSVLISPVARLVAAATSGLSRLLGEPETAESRLLTPAELKVMVAASEEEGLIERQERTMIDNILELEEKTVREVMVPRPDIVALSANASVRSAVDTFVREGYSRMPIYRDTIDDIVGILYGKDLFPLIVDNRYDSPVGEFVRPAYFVPESKRADDLLRELRQQRVHIAVVVDEYGGTAGMVTIEDLLEEIVGEIQDEFDVEEQKIIRTSEDEAVVDGGVSIDDANEELGLDLRAEEVDTIGGLVHEQLGRIPVIGDKVLLGQVLLTVVASSGRRVTRVRVKRLADIGVDQLNGRAEGNHSSQMRQ
ncbi:MAG TPA: hemolysin family protein [Chloroflexota bacterium]|nr:hemolysin family protein [Chloroflexota bacterium]